MVTLGVKRTLHEGITRVGNFEAIDLHLSNWSKEPLMRRTRKQEMSNIHNTKMSEDTSFKRLSEMKYGERQHTDSSSSSKPSTVDTSAKYTAVRSRSRPRVSLGSLLSAWYLWSLAGSTLDPSGITYPSLPDNISSHHYHTTTITITPYHTNKSHNRNSRKHRRGLLGALGMNLSWTRGISLCHTRHQLQPQHQ
jgi:hypothetical protein